MTTSNFSAPQRIKSKSREELERRTLALEAANAKCGEAIAAAVAAEREACAKLAEELTWFNSAGIAATIRARGKVTK